MKFSYNWLQSYFTKKMPKPDKLAEILTLHFAEVEEIKKQGNDFILDIDVRPNRAGDCFSHNGIAREISAILNTKHKIQNTKLAEGKKPNVKDFVRVQLQGRGSCYRYTARVVAGIKIGPSPKWMQDRLITCGLRPINNIVDTANYVMLETGQPLHAFDAEKIEDRKIIVRMARQGEKIISLDGNKYDLGGEILVIADSKKPIAIAGIKGGKSAEISQKTKTIVIEAANFNPKAIRRASKKIDLRTDASVRFEHGLDPNLTQGALERAAYLIQKLSGGKIAQGLIDVYPKKILPKSISLDLNYIESLLGIKISEKAINRILKNLGFGIKKQNSRITIAEVPTRRMDISAPEDLIEEIGRIYGYDKILPLFPRTQLAVPKINEDLLWENIAKDAMKESGFNEVWNYSFISERDIETFKWPKDDLPQLANPLSSDFQYLRPSLIPGLLRNIEKNQKNFKDIKLFEISKIFRKKSEKKMLVGAMAGDKFYEAKGAVEATLQRMGISDITFDEYQAQPKELKSFVCYPQKSAEIRIAGEKIGFLGEILPLARKNYKIENKVILIDIDFGKLAKLASAEQEYRPISKFPLAVRDIAVLVPLQIKVEEVLNKINEAGGELVRDVDLFDIYDGGNLPEGRKNLAFHIIYQSEEKTLSSPEIDEIQRKIISALEKMPDWQVRK